MMSSNSKVPAIIALVACFGLANAAHSATYSILVDVSSGPGGFTADPGPAGAIDVEGPAGAYTVDFYLQSSDYVSGERGFAFTTFDVTLTDVTNTSSPGWMADTTQVSDGTSTVDLWDENEDLSTDDLQEIIAAIAVIPSPHVDDERPDATHIGSVAVPVPTFIGSLIIDYDGVGSGTLDAIITSTGHANDADGAWVNNTSTSTKFNALINFAELPGWIDSGPGDEDESLMVDLVDFNNVINNLGNVGGPEPSGNGFPGDENEDATVDLIDFNNVINNLGNDYSPGLAFVPEPASAALLALGGLGLIARRRQA